jgi:hypothetical protein
MTAVVGVLATAGLGTPSPSFEKLTLFIYSLFQAPPQVRITLILED